MPVLRRDVDPRNRRRPRHLAGHGQARMGPRAGLALSRVTQRVSAERWERICAVLDEAMALPPADRAAFVEAACGSDAPLLTEVQSLLTSTDDASLFFRSL